MKRLGWLAFAVVASACVKTSDVVPVSRDTYMITASNDTCGNCEPAQIRAAKAANAFCGKTGRIVDVRDSKDETFDIGFGKKVTLTFACLIKSAE